VALALAHKDLEVEGVVIAYSDRSAVERVSGQPLVPVIEEDGEVVFDSARILRWLEQKHPDPPLYPREPARRAEMDIFIEWFDEVWKHPPNEIERQLGLLETDHEHIKHLGARMAGWLDMFESLLDGRDFLFGESFSAADCIAYPFVKYAAGRHPKDEDLFHRILDDYQSVEGRPRLEAWIKRMDDRPRAY
jgi:glutathione S-transferase